MKQSDYTARKWKTAICGRRFLVIFIVQYFHLLVKLFVEKMFFFYKDFIAADLSGNPSKSQKIRAFLPQWK